MKKSMTILSRIISRNRIPMAGAVLASIFGLVFGFQNCDSYKQSTDSHTSSSSSRNLSAVSTPSLEADLIYSYSFDWKGPGGTVYEHAISTGYYGSAYLSSKHIQMPEGMTSTRRSQEILVQRINTTEYFDTVRWGDPQNVVERNIQFKGSSEFHPFYYKVSHDALFTNPDGTPQKHNDFTAHNPLDPQASLLSYTRVVHLKIPFLGQLPEFSIQYDWTTTDAYITYINGQYVARGISCYRAESGFLEVNICPRVSGNELIVEMFQIGTDQSLFKVNLSSIKPYIISSSVPETLPPPTTPDPEGQPAPQNPGPNPGPSDPSVPAAPPVTPTEVREYVNLSASYTNSGSPLSISIDAQISFSSAPIASDVDFNLVWGKTVEGVLAGTRDWIAGGILKGSKNEKSGSILVALLGKSKKCEMPNLFITFKRGNQWVVMAPTNSPNEYVDLTNTFCNKQ